MSKDLDLTQFGETPQLDLTQFQKEPERTWGEAAKDTGAALMQGGAGLVKSAGDLYGLATGNMENPVSQLGQSGQEYWEEAKSGALRRKIAKRKEDIDASPSTLGKAWTAVKDTVTDPALAMDTVAGNAATMLPGAAVGRLAAGAKMAAGMKAAQEFGPVALGTQEALATQAARLGTGVAVGAGAAQQGADVSGDIYSDLMKKKDATWDANPEFAQAVARNGGDREAAKREMATQVARASFLPAAGVSAVANAFPGATMLEKALVGGAARDTIKEGTKYALPKAIAKGMAGEGAQEFVEEGGGRLAANIAAQKIADPSHDTWDQVGENAGMGLAGGLLMGAGGGAFHRQAHTNQPTPPEQPPQPPSDQSTGVGSGMGGTEPFVPPAFTTNPQPTTLGTQITATAGPGFDANSVLPKVDPVRDLVQQSADAGGPVSAAALVGIDSGAHEIQLANASAADQDVYNSVDLDSADKPITHGQIAEAAMSDDDKRAVLYSNQPVADGGQRYPGTKDGDILNGSGAPFSTWQAAGRRATMEGKDWTIAKVADGFVARRKDAMQADKRTAEPVSARQADATPDWAAQAAEEERQQGPLQIPPKGMNMEQRKANLAKLKERMMAGRQSQANPVQSQAEPRPNPGKTPANTRPELPQFTTNPQPTTLGTQTTAKAGPGFDASYLPKQGNQHGTKTAQTQQTAQEGQAQQPATNVVIPPATRYQLTVSPSRDGMAPLSKDDADFHLEVLEERARKGKLTPEVFANSEIGQRLDTGSMQHLVASIKSDPVGTIAAIRQHVSDGKQPAQPAANAGEGASQPTQAAKPKKPSLKQRMEAERKARADYFTPGNVVKGYSGYDRVIDYKAPDEKGNGWSVTVQHVINQDGKWVVDPNDSRVRTHATHPDAKEMKNGPVYRAQSEQKTPSNESTGDKKQVNKQVFEHSGLKISQQSVKIGDTVQSRWVVQSPENAEREAKGERQIGGDAIVDSREEAVKTAERETARYAEEKARKAEFDRQEQEAKKQAEAKKEANRNKSLLERRADAILDKPTNLPPQAGLGTGTRRESMDKAVSQGRFIEQATAFDSAAKKKDTAAVDFAKAKGYILGLSNENIPVVKAALEARARLKENKYEKPEYRVYSGSDRNGSFYEISKTEYDYAQSLKTAEQEAPANTEPEAKADAPKESAIDAALRSVGIDPNAPVDKAKKLRMEAERIATEARKMLDGIVPGQPVLSARDRNLREKSAEKMRKAGELFKEADRLDAGKAVPADKKPSAKDYIESVEQAKQDAKQAAKEAPKETITPADDKAIGKNDAGEPLYERKDGSVYRIHDGKPDFGGDLAPKQPSAPANTANDATEKVAKPSKSKKPAGGKNLRAAAYDKNPLMTFLATHGLFHDKDKPNSHKSEFSPDKTIMVMGYGPVFKKTGKRLDVLTNNAIEEGYLPKDGTESQLRELVRRAISGEKISPLYAQGIAEQIAEQSYAEHLAQQQEAAQNEDFDDPFAPMLDGDFVADDFAVPGYDEASDPIKLEVNALLALADDAGINEDALDSIKEDAHYATLDQSEQAYYEAYRDAIKAAIAASGRDSSADTGETGNAQGQGSQEGLTLTSPSRQDVIAQQDALEAEAKRKEEGGDKPLPRRQLTGDVPDMFSTQGSVFDQPAEPEAPVAPVDRVEVGKSLTKEQRKAVLATLVDVYKATPEVKTYTAEDVAAAEKQAAQQIEAWIDKLKGDAFLKIAKRFLPTMGVKPTLSKASNKAAFTGPKVNLLAAASELGVELPVSVRAALEAKQEGKVQDAVADSKPTDKIADFGEKIGGAKKDTWTGFKDDLSAVQAKETENGKIGLFNQRDGGDVDPAEAQRVQSAIEGKSLIDAARFIAETGSKANAEVAAKVIKKLEWLEANGADLRLIVAHRGDHVPVEMIGARGYTQSNLDDKGYDITVWVHGADVTGSVGVDYETVLHELVHAATTGELLYARYNQNTDVGKAFADLGRVAAAVESHINQRFSDALEGKVALTEFEKDIQERANNAFRNLDEFVSWALTSRDAQDYLESITYKSESLWTRFVQAIRTALGLTPNADTALSEILRVSEVFLSNNGVKDRGITAFWHKRGVKMSVTQSNGSIAIKQRDSYEVGNMGHPAASRVKFSRTAQGQTNGTVEKTVADIVKGWATRPKIVVAFDMNDERIPERVRMEDQKQRSGGASGAPEGFYYKGTVYLMSSKLATPEDVARVLFHEALGHHGLRSVFGKKLNSILNRIAMARKSEVDAKMAQYGLKGISKVDRLTAAEEILAEMAQTKPNIGFVREAIAAIRTWLRENIPGFKNLALTDDEIIRSYIIPARNFVERGGIASTGPLSAAFMRSASTQVGFDSRIDDTTGGAGITKPMQVDPATLEFREKEQNRKSDLGADTDEFDPIVVIGEGQKLSILDGHNRAAVALDRGDKLKAVRVTSAEYKRLQEKGFDDGEIAWAALQRAGQSYAAGNLDSQFHGAEIAKGGDKAWDELLSNESTAPDSGGAPMFSRSEALRKVGDVLNEAFNHPGTVSKWHTTVGSMYNLAERSPAFKKVFDAAQDFLNDVSYYGTEAANQAPKILPKLETIKDLLPGAKEPISYDDNKAISAPIFQGTLSWARDVNGRPVLTDDLKARAADMTTEQKAQDMLRAGKLDPNILRMWQGMEQDHYEAAVNSRYENVMLKPGVVWTDAELKSIFKLNDAQMGLYHEFRNAIDTSIDNAAKAAMLRTAGKDVQALRDMVMDAPTAEIAGLTLRDHLQGMAQDNPDRSDELIAMANEMMDQADKAETLKKEGYAPLSRFGHYTVDVVVNGERKYFDLFESKKAANRMANLMRREYGRDNVAQGTMSQREFEQFQGITPESMELFGNMLGLDSTGNEAQDKAFQTYLRKTKANRSAMKRLIHRKGIEGYSEDVGRVLAAFVYSNARQTAGALNLGRLGEAVNYIPKAQGELKDVAIGLHQYITKPQEEAQAIRGMMFAQYLGGSIASMMVNLTQPMAISFPYLSQYGAGKAAKALTKAYADMKGGDRALENGLQQALKIAEEQGIVAPQEVHQLMAQAQGKATLNSGDGTKLGNLMAKSGNAFTRLALGWGKLFGWAEQINRKATFIAAYRMAAERGDAHPFDFAKKAVNETQFINNRGNKMRWGRGPIGATLMTFKSYSINYLELLHRMATRNDGPEGKKAAAIMLGMLLLMAGAGGLPFAEDLNDAIDFLAERMGYNFSTKKAKQEFLENLLGKPWADFVDRGITGLPGSPIDVSGRMSMANLIPGTGLLLEKRDHSRDVQELLGPVGDMAKRAFEGANAVLDGDIKRALLSVAPKAISNAAQGADMAQKGYYADAKGFKVLSTTPGEAVAKAIGFQPQSVSMVQESNAITQRMKDTYALHAEQIRSEWAKGIFEHDPEQIQKARDMLADWNAKNPGQTIIVRIPDVMKKAREMAKDKDQRIADTAPKAMRAQLKQEIQQRKAYQ